MRCKICVLSVGLLKRALSDEIHSMDLPADFIFCDTLETSDGGLPREARSADVFLSSGQLAKMLRTMTDCPVITIEPSVYDILSAYSAALAYDPKPVIIFPLKRYTSLVENLRNVLAVDIISNWYDEVEAIDLMIASYKAQGCKCIVGSGLVCEKARAAGLQGVFLYPNESLRSYVKLAFDVGSSICERANENQRMASVIAHSKSGIIFTDETGKISICNPMARQFFSDLKKNPADANIFDLLAEPRLRSVYGLNEQINHIVCQVGDERYILSATPILRKGALCNVMLTMDNVKMIQTQEYHIRSALAQKGFTAHRRFENYHSESAAFNSMLETAKRYAGSQDSIVILGETGTGKELLAQSIHNYSTRAKMPFVAVNCSAISETLLESELFGYDEGAFTGARKGGKQGYFEMAHTGTIFLDEIGEMSMALQSKLLRVLQEMQVIHVGGSRMIDLDVRVIAATNRDLWALVRQKKFREDLYYRLDVLELNLPPLRKRREDIYPMFLRFVAGQSADTAFCMKRLGPRLEETLEAYDWPGNIRELENFAKMIQVTCDMDMDPEQAFRQIKAEMDRRRSKLRGGQEWGGQQWAGQSDAQDGEMQTAREDEMGRIRSCLQAAGGNYTKAAQMLGISRVTLWRKLKQSSEAEAKQ